MGQWGMASPHIGARRETVHYTLPVMPLPLLPTFHPGTQTNGWACGSVLHLEKITRCLKHYPPVEMTHNELVCAPITSVLAQGTEFIMC